jgi:hypothetical protein
MRCESWMNKAPIPTRTPLQIAQADMRYWADRKRDLLSQLEDADDQFKQALATVERLDRQRS